VLPVELVARRPPARGERRGLADEEGFRRLERRADQAQAPLVRDQTEKVPPGQGVGRLAEGLPSVAA
jgi:hypothetical protein